MKFTEEQLAKMKAAKTAEELIAIAKAEGIEASEDEIKAQFSMLHSEGVLADEELDNVAGGGCGGTEKRYPKEGDRVRIKSECKEYAGKTGTVTKWYLYGEYYVRLDDDGKEHIIDYKYFEYI